MSVSFEKLSDVGDVSPPVKKPLTDSSLTDYHKSLAEIQENLYKELENKEDRKFVDYCNEESPRNFGEFIAKEISNRKRIIMAPLKIPERSSTRSPINAEAAQKNGGIKDESQKNSPLLQTTSKAKSRTQIHFQGKNSKNLNLLKQATKSENKDLFWWEFDRNKEWNIYFKGKNVQNVIKEYERKRFNWLKKN